MRAGERPVHAATIKLAQDIIDFIEARLLEPLNPAVIAKHFLLSVASINNLFKIAFDMPMMEYVRNRRLSLAGRELLTSGIRVIDLAFQYGYETPEAFTKAFARFHGFPPGFVRRQYPPVRDFRPFVIRVELSGGFDRALPGGTESYSSEQELSEKIGYHEFIREKGGFKMERYRVWLTDMAHREDWRILLALSKELEEAGITHKVDGKTMIFAHGLEFPLEKICLTFSWNDERRVMDHFGYKEKARKASYSGFHYFDVAYDGKKVRCMFFVGGSDEANDSLYRDTDVVDVDGQELRVQSLEFYYKNAEPKDEYYEMVERHLKQRGVRG